MLSLLRKNLSFLPSSSLQVRTLRIRIPLREFSSSSFSPPQPSSLPQLHEKHRLQDEIRVSVWWDFDNCAVPSGVSFSIVATAIMRAIRANGIKGPIHIDAYGDICRLSEINREELFLNGIDLHHVPHIPGEKNNAPGCLIDWVSQIPPPAHLFLIFGDRDFHFAGLLNRLRMNNYNILLACPGRAHVALCHASTIMWQWSSMLKGEDLTGKHFNHPPDGPFNSWYGNFNVPLENPFSAAEQPASSQNAELHKPSSDLKLGEVSKSVSRQVMKILSSHPNGISIRDLRAELTKCDLTLDRSFYGYKKFSNFLVSLPHVQLQYAGEGKCCVRLIPSTTSTLKNKLRDITATQKLQNEDKNIDRNAYGIPKISSSYERSVVDDSKSFQSISSQGKPIGEYVDGKSAFPSFKESNVHQPPNELRKTSLGSEKVAYVASALLPQIQLPPNDSDICKNSDNDIVSSEDVSPEILEKKATSQNPSTCNDYTVLENNDTTNCESGKAENKHENLARTKVDEVCHSPSSPGGSSLVEKKKPDESAETYSKSSTFFSWWTFWKSGAQSNDLTAHQNKMVCENSKLSEPEQAASHFEEPKLSEPHSDVKLSEPDQTASHFEEPNSSKPHQDIINSEKPELFEDSKLYAVDQTAGLFEEPKSSELQHDVNHLEMPELFSIGSFWDDVESFIFTPKGLHLLSQSRSREDLAHKLQKHGPLVLMSLTENDILQLVELLIAEKKWLEEIPSQAFPFRLTQVVQKSSLMGQPHGANVLRSLFLNKTPQPNLQKSSKHDVETDCQSIHQTRVSEPAIETECSERSRSDILLDCQKLVSEILRKHPGGFNIGCFRKLFYDRYGYHLNYKKLGYQKLACLLKIMPGAQLDSTYIYPSVPSVGASDSETCILKTQVTNGDLDSDDQSLKEGVVESHWEELGPVSVSVEDPRQNNLESKLTQKAVELDTPKHPDYEPIVLDYDSSESEGDSSCLTHPEKQGKLKCNEKDSSFWEALDLWHSSKEGESSVKKSDNGCVSSSSLLDILNSPTSTTGGTDSKMTSGNPRQKQRSQKSYSFVADPTLPDKDKFIGGILDGFKKDETKMPN